MSEPTPPSAAPEPERIPWSGVVAVVGVESVDGRLILADALDLSIGPSGIWLGDAGEGVAREPIGTVEAVWTDGNLIRAAGTRLPVEVPRGLAIIVDGMHVAPQEPPTVVEEEDGTVTVTASTKPMTVEHARLRMVYVTDLPAWPECVMDDEAVTP